MTSYVVLFSDELLAEVRRDPSQLPAGFRVGEVVATSDARLEPPSWGSSYVRVEDDRAPADLEGKHVEPVLQRERDDEGCWRTVIRSRTVMPAPNLRFEGSR